MRALLSVADKSDITYLAKELDSLGVELISTGGTYSAIKNAGINVTNILNITSFPHNLDSIIKTLYPEIYAAIDVNRNDPVQMKQLSQANIDVFDIVVVNLSPFKNIENPSFANCIDAIDIGGPTMLRSAAKHFKNITVIVDPNDYPKIIDELKKTNNISLSTRLYLMQKVFTYTSNYDNDICSYINENINTIKKEEDI